ncbi:FUSC family protein [Paenibacillus thermotolerans]|uniref:FUSC family protein n=1 Tax=Paenibacillus thermotolerans TaxID=3027807 RepID=UPI0023676AAD|nr:MULTISPECIES: FUSC family protein [unclassified Paenibacillus]
MYISLKAQERNLGRLVLFIIKMSAASGIAWELAKLAGSKHPFLAPLSVILCVQTTVMTSAKYALHRLIGTVIGVTATVWVADALSLNGWTLAFLLMLVSGFSLLFGRKEIVIHEVALSVLLVFSLQKESGHYGLDRIRDTVIGIAVALAVHMIVTPPNLMKPAQRTVLDLMGLLADRFMMTADWIRSGCPEEQKSALHAAEQAFQQMLFKAEKRLETAAESLKLNIFARSSRSMLQDNKRRMSLVKHGAAYLENTTNMFTDWHSSGTLSGDERNRWAEQLRLIGAYWRDPRHTSSGQPIPDPSSMKVMPIDQPHYSDAMHTATAAFVNHLQTTP